MNTTDDIAQGTALSRDNHADTLNTSANR